MSRALLHADAGAIAPLPPPLSSAAPILHRECCRAAGPRSPRTLVIWHMSAAAQLKRLPLAAFPPSGQPTSDRDGAAAAAHLPARLTRATVRLVFATRAHVSKLAAVEQELLRERAAALVGRLALVHSCCFTSSRVRAALAQALLCMRAGPCTVWCLQPPFPAPLLQALPARTLATRPACCTALWCAT